MLGDIPEKMIWKKKEVAALLLMRHIYNCLTTISTHFYNAVASDEMCH